MQGLSEKLNITGQVCPRSQAWGAGDGGGNICCPEGQGRMLLLAAWGSSLPVEGGHPGVQGAEEGQTQESPGAPHPPGIKRQAGEGPGPGGPALQGGPGPGLPGHGG